MPDGIRASCPLHRPAYELYGHRVENTQPSTQHTHFNSQKRQVWTMDDLTDLTSFTVCLVVNKNDHVKTKGHTNGSKCHFQGPSTTRTAEREMRPDNTKKCACATFYCGCLLRPLSDENHMMDRIQLNPPKTSTKLKKKKKGFRGKASRRFEG